MGVSEKVASLVVDETGDVLAERVFFARSSKERRRGLRSRPRLRAGEALWLEPAPQIQTFGMGYPIDVVFCDRDMTVRHVVRNMKPGRITRWVLRGRRAIEFPAGAVDERVRPGVRMRLTEPRT